MIWSIFIKSIKEQLRNFWILILTVSMAPFFVFVYFLINEASQPHYDIIVLNLDQGVQAEGLNKNLGDSVVPALNDYIIQTENAPLSVKSIDSRQEAIKQLEAKKVEALLVLPLNFSQTLLADTTVAPELEIVGDLTSTGYLIAAVWLGELMNHFVGDVAMVASPFSVKETALGHSGQVDEFELWMPGMLILSIIMLMFSATIAIVTEVDQGTILRLKLSGMKAWQFLVGVGLTQVLVGMIAILLTLISASILGFEMRGSVWSFLVIAILTSVSMIAFSLILAALTRSVTDVLVIGNFPLFLFMFFTGAAFPISVQPWFYIGGYGVSWQSLMSPAPAITALQKVSIMGAGIEEVLGELLVLVGITLLYFAVGLWSFNKRHLRTN